jgi:hypothetical protein
MEEKNEIMVREDSPAGLMLKAMATPGMDLDKLEKFMVLQEKWEANQARKAYVEAMAEFKKNPPEIGKDKHVKFGNTEYNHASLGNVTGLINEALSRHGFSAAWETSQTDRGVTVTCKITHILGHSESTSLTAGSDTSGAKNAIQALGSAISYLQRYTILALCGLATHEMDDDAVTATAYIDEKQIGTILDFINEKGVDQAKFLIYMGCESLQKIAADDYKKAITALKAAKGKVVA